MADHWRAMIRQRCRSIELNRFHGCYIPVTGSCCTLSNIWLWNYWISSCFVTYHTTNALLLTHELKYIGPSQMPPECITLIVSSVGITFRCQTHKAHAEFCILCLWQVKRDAGTFPPSPGYSAVSFQCFSVLLISKYLFLCISCHLEQPFCSSASHQLSIYLQFSADKMLPLLLMSLNFFLSHWPYD